MAVREDGNDRQPTGKLVEISFQVAAPHAAVDEGVGLRSFPTRSILSSFVLHRRMVHPLYAGKELELDDSLTPSPVAGFDSEGKCGGIAIGVSGLGRHGANVSLAMIPLSPSWEAWIWIVATCPRATLGLPAVGTLPSHV